MRFVEYSDNKIREVSFEFMKNLEEEYKLKEGKFYFDSLSDAEKDELYQNFYDSYMNSVGSAWSRYDFEWKSKLWTFWGSSQGGIALRHQNSGMWKLNASYGTPKAIFTAFKEMCNDIGDEPIWGAMTDNIATMVEKASSRFGKDKLFLKVPKLIAKAIAPHIKKVFGDGDAIQVNSDGSLTVLDAAGKPINKVLVANKAYYKMIIEQMENNPEKLPIPPLVQKGIIGTLKLFFRKYFN